MLHRLYLAKGVHATTAIEGNTLSEKQVEQHIEGKLELPPSKKYLQVEIANILSGCEIICKQVFAGPPRPLNVETIKSYDRLLLQGLSLPDDVKPGEIRKHEVGVARYKGAPAEDCEYLLERMCEWLAGLQENAPEWMAHAMPILRAILAHLYLAWIHPFGDGNGRTARLIEFAILIEAAFRTPAAHLLSNHYNETRSEYYRQLDFASKSGGDLRRHFFRTRSKVLWTV